MHKEAREAPGSTRAATRGKHIASAQLITLLITLLSNDSLWSLIQSNFAQLTYNVTMALFCTTSPEQQVSMVLASTTSSIPDKSYSLSRWPWSSPFHRNNTSLGAQPPPRFESSLNHLTLSFSSPRGCARFTVKIRRPLWSSPLAAAQDTRLQRPNSFPSST